MARVLVVDDNKQIKDVLTKVLTSVGYDVIEEEDGEQALEIYGGGGIDVVVLDVMTGGTNTLMDFRRDFPDVKMIAIVGSGLCGEVTDLEMALGIGADKAIGKPFKLDDFFDDIKELSTPQGVPT